MIYHGTSVNECMREPVPIRTGSFLSNEKIWGTDGRLRKVFGDGQ